MLFSPSYTYCVQPININSLLFSSVICYSCRFYYVHFYLIPLAKVYHHCESCHVGVLGVVSMVPLLSLALLFFLRLWLWFYFFDISHYSHRRSPGCPINFSIDLSHQQYMYTRCICVAYSSFPSLPLLIFNFAFSTRVFMHEWIVSSKKTSLFCFSDVSHFPFLLRHHHSSSSSSITFTFLCLLSTLTTHPLISFSPSFPFHLQNFFLYLSLSIIQSSATSTALQTFKWRR